METENQALAGGFEPRPPELQVTAPMKNYLLQTAKWARFLAILGFIIIGLLVVGAFTFGTFMNSLMTNFPDSGTRMPGGSSVFMTVYLLILAAISFYPTLYLYQFATKTKVAILYGDDTHLTFAFSRLKSFFKFWGILIIIFFVFYALLIIGYTIGATYLD